MKSSKRIEDALHDCALSGQICFRRENNQYLKISYKGGGDIITEKWNVKIYNSGKIVTNDSYILNQIINKTLKKPDENLKVIKIDDAGIGFPLGGVMIGIDDGNDLWVDIVDPAYFQGELYKRKEYLDIYTKKGLQLINKLGFNPENHRIEICSGYINQRLKTKLRDLGFHVTITKIIGSLQDELEKQYRDYIKRETKEDLYYDPKEIPEPKIPQYYFAALKWGKKYSPNFIKSGWTSLKI